MAQMLDSLSDENNLIPAFASSNIDIYPYQIAAAQFALRSSYLKGCILCDEGSLGKTFEAMLIATPKWYEGQNRQLVVLPTNLIKQWITKIENSFKLPDRFRVETPIGTYNPDWAVYLEKNGEQKLFFVLETKGSMGMFDLRTREQLKIHCGKRHFEALENVSLQVREIGVDLRRIYKTAFIR